MPGAISTLNLDVLKKTDQSVCRLLFVSPQAALYKFDSTEWVKRNIAGPIFLVERTATPQFEIILLNREGETDFVLGLTHLIKFQHSHPYIIFMENNETHGLWLFDEKDAKTFANIVPRLSGGDMTALAEVPALKEPVLPSPLSPISTKTKESRSASQPRSRPASQSANPTSTKKYSKQKEVLNSESKKVKQFETLLHQNRSDAPEQEGRHSSSELMSLLNVCSPRTQKKPEPAPRAILSRPSKAQPPTQTKTRHQPLFSQATPQAVQTNDWSGADMMEPMKKLPQQVVPMYQEQRQMQIQHLQQMPQMQMQPNLFQKQVPRPPMQDTPKPMESQKQAPSTPSAPATPMNTSLMSLSHSQVASTSSLAPVVTYDFESGGFYFAPGDDIISKAEFQVQVMKLIMDDQFSSKLYKTYLKSKID